MLILVFILLLFATFLPLVRKFKKGVLPDINLSLLQVFPSISSLLW